MTMRLPRGRHPLVAIALGAVAALGAAGCGVGCDGGDEPAATVQGPASTGAPSVPSDPLPPASGSGSTAEPETRTAQTDEEDADRPGAGATSSAGAPTSGADPEAAGTLDAAAQRGEVEDAVQDYIDAFRGGRGEEGCAAMTEGARQELLARAAAEGLQTSECAVALEAASEAAGSLQRTALRFADVADVMVDGAEATAVVDVLGERYPVRLERQQDRWLVASLPDV